MDKNEIPDTPYIDREPCKAVPVEPTEAMLIAARDWSYKKYGQSIGNDAAKGCWKAMLDATPAQFNPPEGEGRDWIEAQALFARATPNADHFEHFAAGCRYAGQAIASLRQRVAELEGLLAESKRQESEGWSNFYKLRRQYAEEKYPGMDKQIRTAAPKEPTA